MFTGLVEGLGRIGRIEASGPDRRVWIDTADVFDGAVGEGESIAVSGACLTAVEPGAEGFWADVSAETLACTTLGDRETGDVVNLERALLPTTRLGGHLVAGHVDGVGTVTAREADGRSWRFRIRVPEELARYVAPKGSIAVDGISLTVNEVEGAEFGVNIVPHTMQLTTLGDTQVGTRVNLEADVVARYLERLLTAGDTGEGGVARDLLARAGRSSGD